MFGMYRFMLASFVVVFHIAPVYAPGAGSIAVFSFYVLSGYLITRVVSERYDEGVGGVVRFFLNRILRLYPAYLSILALSVLAITLYPDFARSLNPAMRMPADFGSWVQNLTMFGMLRSTVRLVPPAWSVNIELIYYMIIALALGRSRAVVVVWALSAGLMFLYFTFSGHGPNYTYFSFFGPSVCFAFGALVYYFGGMFQPERKDAICAVVFIALVAFAKNVPEPNVPGSILLAVAVLVATYATWALSSVRSDNGTIRRLDSYLGDMAYPVFLSHWIVAALVVGALGYRPGPTLLLLLVAAGTLAVSSAVVFGIERPIEVIRKRVRPRDHSKDRPAVQPGQT